MVNPIVYQMFYYGIKHFYGQKTKEEKKDKHKYWDKDDQLDDEYLDDKD